MLLQSLRSALSGNLWLESRIAATLAETLRGHSSSKNATVRPEEYKLTRRELDIIASIAGGRTNREVSQDYAISERTVKHHLTNIFGKVGVSTRLELALFAVDHHLVNKETPLSLRMQMDVSE
jgi:DNA-binding NarL/FixJ family response regulator